MHESVTVLLTRFKRGVLKLISEPHKWFVLVGDRLVLAGLLTLLFALGVLFVEIAGIVAVRDTTEMLYLFQALVGGNLTLVTIVLSINQLVLSREFKTPGELRDQIENVIAFRSHVEEATGNSTVPVTPADFLYTLLDGVQDKSYRLKEAAKEQNHPQLSSDIKTLVSTLSSHTDEIISVLDFSQNGIFSALAVTLETNYSEQLNEAYRLRTEYETELTPEMQDALDDLTDTLKQVDIARQYFKSIYIQSELARLSRILLYVGVPAIGSALLMLFVYTGATDPPVATGYLEVVAPIVVILGFAPLAILFSFLLRVAMVAQRTVAITPFTTPSQETEIGK